MSETETAAFVPVLTVMVDYGNAPFLWLVERPDQGGVGGMLCESGGWEDYYPMSEALWRKFAIWAISFARMPLHMIHSDNDHWDWPAFHARGLQLARELKAEVGDAYRVVYEKPAEDPRIAALTNGARCSLMVLYKRCRTLPAANRYSSANASFPAGRPVRTGRLWILLLDHIATICMVAGRRRGAKRRTAAFR